MTGYQDDDFAERPGPDGRPVRTSGSDGLPSWAVEDGSETWDEPERWEQAPDEGGNGDPGYAEPGYADPAYPDGGYVEGGDAGGGYVEGGYLDDDDVEGGYVEDDDVEGGYPDGGYPEAGYQAGGYPQAGYPDAGYPDAGYPDAGYPDAGYPDAGYPDGYPEGDDEGELAGDYAAGEYGEGAVDYEGEVDYGGEGGGEYDGGVPLDYGRVAYIDDDPGLLQRPGGGPAHRRPGPAHGRRRASEYRRRRILAGLGVVVVLVLIVGLIGVIYARRQINPGGQLGPVVNVDIPQDASTSQIGNILAGAGVIHDGHLFPYYTKLTGSSGLLPGKYRLAKNESYGRVINALQRGPVLIVDKLTIPEGFTLAQIAARVAALPGLHFSAAKFLAAGTSGQVRSKFEPAGQNDLEGLVFPATYDVRQGQEEADILQEMVNTFDERVTSLGLAAAAKKLHYTPYQVVTVASIVEREAKLEADRGNVASTIYNRLTKGMTLGADSTQTYYLRLQNPTVEPSVAQLNAPSPYDTRLNTGLPPTPIANPGIPSLQAAIAPPATTYLYFVEINKDGQLGFASDDAGFQTLETQCQAAHLC